MKLTKKQKKLNKKLRHMQTKSYAEEQIRKEINRNLAQWKLDVREQAGNKCEVEGCKAEGVFHPHHILVKERYKEFKTEIKNGVLLCPSHHKYGKFSAHRNSIWFVKWLQGKYPEKYQWALENIGEEKHEEFSDGGLPIIE